jgi:hypothetical protein
MSFSPPGDLLIDPAPLNSLGNSIIHICLIEQDNDHQLTKYPYAVHPLVADSNSMHARNRL